MQAFPPRKRTRVVRELVELIAALDRRVPQVQRAGEASTAREAEALRALERIAELESRADSSRAQPHPNLLM